MSLAEQLNTWASLLDEADEKAYQKFRPFVVLGRSQVADLIRILRDAHDVLQAEGRLLHQIAKKPKKQDEQPASDRKLNEHEAAAMLGLSVKTLQSWRCRGGWPTFIKLGRAVRYSSDELNRWMQLRRRLNTADPCLDGQ